MTRSDSQALRALLGTMPSTRATTDDLQGLLLQVVFALLMVFMIAYFIFVGQQKKERAEEVMALNRQKLTLALEKVAENHRVRYGLNALMVQGIDGARTFDPDTLVADGSLRLAPAAHQAFALGGRAAHDDYARRNDLLARWRTDAFAEAKLDEKKITREERAWFADALSTAVENVRLDVRGVQRAIAARLQKQWIAHPDAFRDATDPRVLADRIRRESLHCVATEIGAEVLP